MSRRVRDDLAHRSLLAVGIRLGPPENVMNDPNPVIDRGRAWELGLRNRDFYGSYQNHKETIAWLATAFYVGGISALMLNEAWPKWPGYQRIGLLLMIVGATWLVTNFVRWQFDQRTFGVTMVDASIG